MGLYGVMMVSMGLYGVMYGIIWSNVWDYME